LLNFFLISKSKLLSQLQDDGRTLSKDMPVLREMIDWLHRISCIIKLIN
jgi:hypothetical protein